MTNKLYFSRKQYFRDTTAPAGLSEVINVRQAIPVQPKQKIFPEPVLLNQRSDYFGNDLFTYRDIQGNIKTISIMKGANKPRGINANVKWSMSPNKFKRGRGLNSRDGFIKPMSRRGETTEFFKSRYQSAYGEMLIQQKIKDADKLSKKKTKVLKDELKKKEDKIEALVKSNAQTIQNLKDQNKADMDTLKLQLGVMYSGGMSGGGFQGGQRPTGFSSDTVGDTGTDPILSKGKGGGKGGGKTGKKGKGGGKGKPPPPPPPSLIPTAPTTQGGFLKKKPLTEEQIKQQEEKKKQQAEFDRAKEIQSVIGQGLTPSQIKAMKQKAKEEKLKKLKESGDTPPLVLAESPIKPADEPADEPQKEPADEPSVEDTGAGVEFTDQPLEEGFLEKTITAPELTSKQKQQQAVVDILETSFEADPQGETPTQPRKSKFSSFIENLGDIKGKKPSKKFLKDLETQIEAEEKLKKGAEELGETLTANIGGEKQTSTPAPKIPPPQPTPKSMPAPPFETPPIPPPLSEAQKTELKIPASSLPPVESPIIAPPLSEVKQPDPISKPETPPKIPPLSEAKPEKDTGVEIEGFFSSYINKAISDSDEKGDYFDNLRLVNDTLKKEYGGFSSKVPQISESKITELVNIFPQRPNYKEGRPFVSTADEPSVEPTPEQQAKIDAKKQKAKDELRKAQIHFGKNPFSNRFEIGDVVFYKTGDSNVIHRTTKSSIAFNKKQQQELIDAQARRNQEEFLRRQKKEREEREARQKESKDRQLKVITDKYAGVDFSRSNKTILKQMFKQIEGQNLSADLFEPTIDRAVRDLNAYLSISGKKQVRKDMIAKAKGDVFGSD